MKVVVLKMRLEIPMGQTMRQLAVEPHHMGRQDKNKEVFKTGRL